MPRAAPIRSSMIAAVDGSIPRSSLRSRAWSRQRWRRSSPVGGQELVDPVAQLGDRQRARRPALDPARCHRVLDQAPGSRRQPQPVAEGQVVGAGRGAPTGDHAEARQVEEPGGPGRDEQEAVHVRPSPPNRPVGDHGPREAPSDQRHPVPADDRSQVLVDRGRVHPPPQPHQRPPPHRVAKRRSGRVRGEDQVPLFIPTDAHPAETTALRVEGPQNMLSLVPEAKNLNFRLEPDGGLQGTIPVG